MPSLRALAVLAALALGVRADNFDASSCDCGYIDAVDPDKGIFTDLFYADFTNISSVDALSLFRYADETISRSTSPYTRTFLPSQASIEDDGLHLKITADTSADTVYSGAINTLSKDFGYGSYQMTGKVTNLTGTVSAFYVYYDDNSEVDMEYVSNTTKQMMRDSVKPQEYLANGAAAPSTYQTELWTNGSFSDAAHTWSFSWTPDLVKYALDFNYTRNVTVNVPSKPGLIAISHWSDGNPAYSMGPPSNTSHFVVSSLWAVYNSSTTAGLSCQKAKTACKVSSPAYSAHASSASSIVKSSASKSATSIRSSNTATVTAVNNGVGSQYVVSLGGIFLTGAVAVFLTA